jgi:hypothetical protein
MYSENNSELEQGTGPICEKYNKNKISLHINVIFLACFLVVGHVKTCVRYCIECTCYGISVY